ncbi:MAG: hypothetical protein HC913_15810 [Microscillaceae bacterium]|nr:hypothetical protein [Microscillaceae bacterium]
MRVYKFLCISLAFCFFSACSSDTSKCKKCEDFKTQAEAKAYAKSHPKCKKKLDADGDGKFCETLP